MDFLGVIYGPRYPIRVGELGEDWWMKAGL
jgi:hypothetical protein